MSILKKTIFLFFITAILQTCGEVTANKVSEKEAIETEQNRAIEEPGIVKDSTITLDYIRGHFNPAKHEHFATVAGKYTNGARTYYLRKEAYAAFQEMHQAAAADGVSLKIISATRNFASQKSIWEAKWTGVRLLEGRENATKVYPDPVDRAYAILRWSSMPGTSRHHWGTDMDINALTNEYFEKDKGLQEYEWLSANAASFGFCQPYSPKGDARPHGYNEEKWHWSYEPLARQLTDLAGEALQNEAISGFQGAETATQIDVVNKYILGVSQDCLE